MNISHMRKIVVSGGVSALAAFPLSIGFALIAGVPPAMMVAASIYAGVFSAIFSCRYGVGGPNAATAFMTGAALMPFAPPESSLYLGYVFTLCLLVGVYQLIFAAILRKVDILDYVSTTVIDGVIFGVGATFVLGSIWMTFGLAQPGGFQWTVFHALMSVDRVLDGSAPKGSAIVGICTVVAGLAAMRVPRVKRYAVLIGIGAGCLAALVVGGPMEQVGWVSPDLLAPSLPDLRQVSWPVVFNLAGGPAFAVALVGTLQSLTAAKTIRDPDEAFRPARETANQGMQHLFMAFFSGAPVAISYNKSTLKQALGGGWDSHLANVVATLGMVYLLGDWVARIPLAALGGGLVLVGLGMMAPEKYRRHARHGRLRKWLFILPAASAILLDVQTAAYLGVTLSVVAHLAGLSTLSMEIFRTGATVTAKLKGVLFYVSSTRLEREVLRLLADADKEGLHDAEKLVLDFCEVKILTLDHIGFSWVGRLATPVVVRARPEQRELVGLVLESEGIADKVTMEFAVRKGDRTPVSENPHPETVSTRVAGPA